MEQKHNDSFTAAILRVNQQVTRHDHIVQLALLIVSKLNQAGLDLSSAQAALTIAGTLIKSQERPETNFAILEKFGLVPDGRAERDKAISQQIEEANEWAIRAAKRDDYLNTKRASWNGTAENGEEYKEEWDKIQSDVFKMMNEPIPEPIPEE